MPSVVSYTTVSLMMLSMPFVGSRTNITSAEFAEFGGRAESVINAKIAKQYSLPLSQSVPLLETLATDIGCYYVLSRRVFTGEKKNDSEWPDRFKEAMNLLDDVASGKTPLIGADGGIVGARTDQNEAWSSTMDYEPVMTADEPVYQVEDEDRIEDIRDDRGLLT